MATLQRAMRVGAGLAGLGYGVYRWNQGKRDWVTHAAMTTGLTVTLQGLTAGRINTGLLQTLSATTLNALK